MDLMDVMLEGTVRAVVLHAREKAIEVPDLEALKHQLLAVIEPEWKEFCECVKVAKIMGRPKVSNV